MSGLSGRDTNPTNPPAHRDQDVLDAIVCDADEWAAMDWRMQQLYAWLVRSDARRSADV